MKALQLWPALMTIALVGCTSTYRTLVSEEDVPLLSGLLEAAESCPHSTTRIATRLGDEPAAYLAIHETGQPSEDRVVLLLHGCSSDASTWRFVVGALGKDHDLILVDLLGCGMSDSPDPASLGPRGYSPDALAERVMQALDAYLADRPDVRITLVGHSLGGAIGIRMTGSPELRARHPRLVERVDRMVLLAPLDVEFPNPPPVIVELAKISEIQIAIGDATGILQELVAQGIRESVCNPERALREDVDKFCSLLTHRETRVPLQAILLQARPMDGDDLDWPAVKSIVRDYANVDIPCLILWGAYDDTLPLSMGYKVAGQIPTAEFYIVEDCKHSIQLEYPVLCADVIRRFTESGEVLVEALTPAWPAAAGVDGRPERFARVVLAP